MPTRRCPHAAYTQRGDIFLNFHPDRLEVVNPGLLPLGVTPSNILHQTVRRNEYLARVFHDLNFMEREGSGFDKIFEVLLAHGRSLPLLVEGPDSVHVTIQRRIIKPELIGLMAKANESFKLTQRERICLGILALGDGLTAVGLAAQLELPGVDALKSWLGRLLEVGLVKAQGRTKGTRYYVPPEVLGQLRFEASTTLARIEPHRLRELLLEDLRRYPGSAIGASHARIGREIPLSQVKRKLEQMESEGAIRHEGDFRWRRYWAVE
jgi:ATP-dependent DNA helicase RecG